MVKLLTQAWEMVKGDTVQLGSELSNSFRVAYAEVWRFNCLVDYDLTKVPMGNGALNAALESKSKEVKAAMAVSITKLAAYLQR